MGLLRQTTPEHDRWTVSELTRYVRDLFEIDYRLQDIEVTGEISNFSQARSGHLYFTLKDDAAQLKCVMWRSSAERLGFRPQDGDAVIAQGRLSVYEAGGVYQLYADSLTPAGRGNLALAFEQLKERLAAEGLFSAERKRPIPSFPRKIGIVTSPDAAALRDILHVLQRRCPLVGVLIAPTLVQGPEAPAQIVRALQWLDGRSDIDTIIIARGGGSIEDLWAFNDEQVVRTIAAARHPILSGVGHETDFTITDFVADERAPTPSAAAERAVPDLSEMRVFLGDRQQHLTTVIQRQLQQHQADVVQLRRALSHLSPRVRLENNRQRIDNLSDRIEQLIKRRLERSRSRLALAQAGLTAVGPVATLRRGYAIVRRQDGQIVRSITAVTPGDLLAVQVVDGEFTTLVRDA
ncbi:MAG: exodeoxyribonuclease VII large subunit [Chloroflexota bacterium]|jgi:exodeoxyribonuclease VII large subunit